MKQLSVYQKDVFSTLRSQTVQKSTTRPISGIFSIFSNCSLLKVKDNHLIENFLEIFCMNIILLISPGRDGIEIFSLKIMLILNVVISGY